MYATDSSNAMDDYDYVLNQGGNDVFENLGGVDESAYMIALLKRKFQTGDNNRDRNITAGANTFCFILGDNFVYTSFVQAERVCLQFNLTTSYYSNFRVSAEIDSGIIEYVEPENTVVVVKHENLLIFFIGSILLLMIWINIFILYFSSLYKEEIHSVLEKKTLRIFRKVFST